MKPYEEYQPTEYDWLPEIPKHWDKRYLFQVNDEQSISNKNIHHQNLLSLSYGNIIKKDINSTKGLLPESFDTYQLVYDGNIILRLTDLQNDHKSLRVGLATQTGIITSAYTCLKPKSVSSKFMYYLLHSFDLRKVFYGMGGGLRQGMGFKDLKYLQLYIPRHTEQDQIVKFLDSKIFKINKFIKEKKREIELLKEQKQAEINRAVTKGLNPNVPMKESGIDWIGEIPKHWAVRRLRTFCDFVNRGSTPAYTEEKLTKVVNQATFSKGYWDLKNVRYSTANVENSRGLLFHDDILLASTGGGVLGKSYLFKENDSYIADSHVTIIRDSKRRFIPEYLYYFLSVSYDLINGIFAQGSTNQIELQRNWLRSMFFPYPDINEQRDIAVFLMNFENTINTIIRSIEIEIVKIQEYKTSLISEVVTGKVDVRDVKIEEIFELEALEEIEAEVEAEEVTEE